MRECEGYPYAGHYSNLMWKAWQAAEQQQSEALKGAAVIAEATGAEIRKLRSLLAEVAAVKRYNANKAWPNCVNNFWSMNMPRELLERIDVAIEAEKKAL
jgi:hypothetical protein